MRRAAAVPQTSSPERQERPPEAITLSEPVGQALGQGVRQDRDGAWSPSWEGSGETPPCGAGNFTLCREKLWPRLQEGSPGHGASPSVHPDWVPGKRAGRKGGGTTKVLNVRVATVAVSPVWSFPELLLRPHPHFPAPCRTGP